MNRNDTCQIIHKHIVFSQVIYSIPDTTGQILARIGGMMHQSIGV